MKFHIWKFRRPPDHFEFNGMNDWSYRFHFFSTCIQNRKWLCVFESRYTSVAFYFCFKTNCNKITTRTLQLLNWTNFIGITVPLCPRKSRNVRRWIYEDGIWKLGDALPAVEKYSFIISTIWLLFFFIGDFRNFALNFMVTADLVIPTRRRHRTRGTLISLTVPCTWCPFWTK